VTPLWRKNFTQVKVLRVSTLVKTNGLFISVFKLKAKTELTNHLGYSKEVEPNEKVFLVHHHHKKNFRLTKLNKD
jgi:hypothetical protein